jgi:hypothetical protein
MFLSSIEGGDTYCIGTLRKRQSRPRDPTECLPFHVTMDADPVSETGCSLGFRIPDDGQSRIIMNFGDAWVDVN